MSTLDIALSTLLSPVVLFFILGLGAALLRSQMSIPEAFAKGLSIYLMMAIGLKGGVEMSKTVIGLDVIVLLVVGMALSFSIPVLAYAALRFFSRLKPLDAAATAGHYGSISIVTFVTAIEVLNFTDIGSSGHMVAVAAIMEVPAIVTALLLARRTCKRTRAIPGGDEGELFREVFLNASVVVLLGSLAIGWIGGIDGMSKIEPFFVIPFQGVLCLFLLDMGLSAGRGLRQGRRQLDAGALSFGIYMPLLSAGLTALLCLLLPLGTGDAALLITLAASASYIAVPAATRLAIPQAQSSIYLTLSLGVTFPFNVIVGIPIYIFLANLVAG
ncbi:MAG: sodium-dependent bicarbonate transport family permease [Hyphomonadaceae bacterium]|nr:sodium-dependent bicarbonate transport family permease [Hyphomonadaceae bacterium]MBC6411563.1 sodium-dependent bicarbonate transport family permease [Hyphomonadaceae bacterium]